MKTEDGTSTVKILAEFAVKYNEAAHWLLDLTLHSCTPVVGDMFMVIMQYVLGVSLFNVPMPLLTFAQEVVCWDVSKALKLLHRRNWVFGNLWEANVLYSLEDGGCDEENRYSACLSLKVRLVFSRL